MLLKIKQFIIENKGFKADFVFKDVYINSSKIVSISDYAGIKEFLTAENPNYSNLNFSIVKLDDGNRTEEIIALGTAESIYSEVSSGFSGKKQILNG
tara:strand:- start:1003 stop:1293 length:291 start_codon:yes stop_codon:yes gene_type:complete